MMCIVHMNNFTRAGGMRKAPFSYLNTKTGLIIRGWGRKDENDGIVHFYYESPVDESVCVLIPTVEAYLRKQFINERAIGADLLRDYSIDMDMPIDRYLVCTEKDYYGKYGEFLGNAYELFEDYDISHAYQKYAREKAPALEKEWLKDHAIEMI